MKAEGRKSPALFFFFYFFFPCGEADITLFQPANSHGEEDGPESRAKVNPPSRISGYLGSAGCRVTGGEDCRTH